MKKYLLFILFIFFIDIFIEIIIGIKLGLGFNATYENIAIRLIIIYIALDKFKII